jgi:catechol 2,3-dioxygenase-like lactoylglutathione lyase family enzyme
MKVTRRTLVQSLALATATRLMAQPAKPPIAARKLSQLTLTVSDLKRSLDFYQGLFGMPVQARQGSTVLLQIGAGPQYMALKEATPKPGITQFGISVEGFNADKIMAVLLEHGVNQGVSKGDAPGPMQAHVKMRDRTPELFLGDPDGVIVQLQDPTYCGGAGPLGNMCAAPEPSPRKGLIALRDLSHFTLFGPNATRSQAFYRDLFGLFIQAHQGTALAMGVGSGPQFLMMAGAAGSTGAINHGCFFMEKFNPDDVLKTLADYGIKPRGNVGGGEPPLTCYVTLRMENRGGSPGGTPELYFTDPDGILLQIQDVNYCGGAGRLGELCS